MEHKIRMIDVDVLIPYAMNARTHSDDQVTQIASSGDIWAILGDYAISCKGVILALPVQRKNKWGGLSNHPAKILAQSNDNDGYKLTTMKRLNWAKNGQVRVHRLVAYCFIGKCPDNHEVNHKDGNKANNAIENLEYVTSKQNKLHALDNGLMKIGIAHHLTKSIKLSKNGIDIVINGAREAVAAGFNPSSIHRAARKQRKSINGWVAEYV